MKIIHEGLLPIKSWADNIEAGAFKQAVNLANLPFAVDHIAIMPDVHEGYGMPIGGVLATAGVVIPNAVGVDIGCGVIAVQTDITTITGEQIQTVVKGCKAHIPLGFKHNKDPQNWEGFKTAPKSKIIQQELKSARHQLASLGGGNHFISIERGSDGYIWLMIHTGSRNLGLKVATYYNELAKKENIKTKLVPPEYDLAGLAIDQPLGQEYLEAMEFCLTFAQANRARLMDIFYGLFRKATGSGGYQRFIDIHHNYATQERHFTKQVVVHRKGATSAARGQMGIIPGSMGTSSYIVEGLGNPESFYSCSHGAGRCLSRTEANKRFSEQEANQSMQGIVFGGWQGDYAEAPMAYKDVERVIQLQSDLIRTMVKLQPLGVLKG